MDIHRIIHAIDHHPLNRGLKGVDWVSNPRNIAICEGDDLALFDYEGPGFYQGHFLFQSRGKEAVEVTKILCKRMFDETDAVLLMGLVPVKYRKAGVIARMAGFKLLGKQHTEHGQVFVYLMAREIH